MPKVNKRKKWSNSDLLIKARFLFRFVLDKFEKYVEGQLIIALGKSLSTSEVQHQREKPFAQHAKLGRKSGGHRKEQWLPNYNPCPCMGIIRKAEMLKVDQTCSLSWGNCEYIGANLHWDIAKAFMIDTYKWNRDSCGPHDVDVSALANIIINCELFENQCKQISGQNIATNVCYLVNFLLF